MSQTMQSLEPGSRGTLVSEGLQLTIEHQTVRNVDSECPVE